MRKVYLFIICLGICNSIIAQNPTYQQKLYYTCKIWGFVKYYHSAVSTCQVNWDSVLVADLPLVKNAVTQNDFNDALDTMLNAAGPMAIATTAAPALLPPELRRNANFSWINDTMLRSDVQVILDTIENNFRPHAECWVEDNQYTNAYTGWLVFPHDSLMLDSVICYNYPDEFHRLTLIFKYWNIINYFNPNNYMEDVPWDSTLYINVLSIVNAQDCFELFQDYKKIVANINDGHAEGLSWGAYTLFPSGYWYGPQLKIKYISNKYVAVKSGIPNISPGDEIVSVAGLTPAQWEDSLRPYISAGNPAVFREFVSEDMLWGNYNYAITIVSKDSLGNNHSTTRLRSSYVYGSWFTDYYPNDTLGNATWKLWNCNVGYVNMGQLQSTDVNQMYSDLQNTSAIIFDIRNYPHNTAWPIADLMYPNNTNFAKLTLPDVTYPGTYSWYYDSLGSNGNQNAYNGKVIILMNEETLSEAEYSCMILDAMPDVVNVGNQTAGADGNVTFFRLSQDFHAGFSTLGVYYPNGDSTQRIGIVPDSLVYPSQVGIRHHRDEVLEKALEIAQCWTSVPQQNSIQSVFSVYPNPSSGIIHVELNGTSEGKIIYTITDITGRIVLQKEIDSNQKNISADLDIHSLSDGMYVLSVQNGAQLFTKKLIKE